MEEIKNVKDFESSEGPGNSGGNGGAGRPGKAASEQDSIRRGSESITMDNYYKNKAINLSSNAIKVLEKRYLKRDEEGVLLETPLEMFVRVARNIVTAEKNYGKTDEEIKEIERMFFDIMSDLDFLPNSLQHL